MTAASSPAFLSLWLPRLPTDRLKRLGAAPADGRAFCVYAKAGNAFALTAVDRRAATLGLRPGLALADARAMRPDLVAVEAEPAKDLAFLDQIAAYCERFSPSVALDPPDGLFLDIAGCGHLFGGDEALLAEALRGLRALGLVVKGAVAETAGAAWAFARYGQRPLDALPVAALRLDPDAAALLKRLGLKTVGQIAHGPRAPFAARAGQRAMRRLDQALGREAEALSPRRPPPPVFAQRRLLEPAVSLEAILIVAADLCEDLCERLRHRGVGARLLALSLFGVDGKTRRLDLGLSRPETAPGAMLRLLKERLQAQAERFEAEFGFEAMRLGATEIAEVVLRPTDLAPRTVRDLASEARLFDQLAARLGESRVGRLSLLDAHAPERAAAFGLETGEPLPPPADGVMRRPLTLLPRPQPIEAIATVPDGPPRRFLWRRLSRAVVRAEGPERIAPNWLRAGDDKTRDYYRVEDEAGRRYWLFREGFYGGETAPRWFVHGLFA